MRRMDNNERSTNGEGRANSQRPTGADPPHALTFFLTEDQRTKVLAKLRRHGRRRAEALVRALGVEQ